MNIKLKKPFPNQDRNNFRRDNSNVRRSPPRCPDVARHAAARLVWLVLEDKRTLDDVMLSEESYFELKGIDRSFAANVAKSTLRYLGHIDLLLSKALQKPLPDTAFYARALLRTGIGQYLADLAPAYAIVGRAVDLAKADRVARGMSGLINAILRKIVTAETKPELDISELIPSQWRARYISTYGTETTNEIAKSLLVHSPIDFTILVDEKETTAKDFDCVVLPNGSLRMQSVPENLKDIDAWRYGEVFIQNAAASIPAKLLKPQKGENILDMCAAPGGKTMQLATTGAKVTALDINDDRLRLVAENLARTKLNAKLISGAAQENCGDNEWDAILLDAPCSATGTLRSNLETLWIKTPFDLPKFIETQCEMVRAAAKGLKTGGRLVYAICSLEPEEADMAYQAAIDAGLKSDPITPEEMPELEMAIEARGSARILPNYWSEKGGLDGFFIARFIK